MKKIILLISAVLITSLAFSQVQKPQVYDEQADAANDIEKAVQLAKANNKHVFVFIGGNWCPWCVRLDKFIHSDDEIKAALYNHYEVVKVSYDKKNVNFDLMEKLGFPQRFGFPVFVILDQEGNRLHTQNSVYVEKDKSYDKKKLIGLFNDWTVKKLDPESYKK